MEEIKKKIYARWKKLKKKRCQMDEKKNLMPDGRNKKN